MLVSKQQALDYHSGSRAGKIEITPTKPCRTQRDLSLAYTPGVAEPCLEIQRNPHDVYKYTGRGNLVAVLSNGTAVLGLGDIGALAGKPVMEGKAVLFKRFADVDVLDIEVNTHDADEIIKLCQLLEPTFGGINLEDIKAPDCFHIEETLRKTMKIPVFHDDQHGTAIISGAALLNAVEIVGKDIGRVHVVFNGAGAAGIACAEHYVRLGVKRENIILCDTKGVVYSGRKEGMNKYKESFAHDTGIRTLAEALVNADVFVGLSVKGALTPEMVRSMARDPIVFAMANPDPEMTYEEAKACRPDVIIATGRSDYPNQVNNVLGFPFIFRGALDVRATTINQEMELAATCALARLAKEDVPDSVCRAYGVASLQFGREYLIPKPFDPRVLMWEASAVAEAAMRTGVAQEPVNLENYRAQLERRLGKAYEVSRTMIHKAQANPKQVVFPEGDNEKILRACHTLVEEKIGKPILLGDMQKIQRKAHELSVDIDGMQIIDPASSEHREVYIHELFRLRQRRGVTLQEATTLIDNRNVFGSMMVRMGDADALVSGVTQHFPDTIRPALQIVRMREGLHRVSGCYVIITRKGEVFFLADTSVNIEPTAEELVEIALCTAHMARRFDLVPRLALLSFSSFGGVDHPICTKVRKAVELIKYADPTLIVDGEIMADEALSPEIIEQHYPFSALKGGANVLIFPDLASANIACKLAAKVGGGELIGPILMGMNRPVHVLQRTASVEEIVNVAAIAVVDAQENDIYAHPHVHVAVEPELIGED
ncbi:MAG TPA: NADP-dependent malic enzyme [Candidatus Sulfotelmatobacter sp.]|nr:NADP-dependent malic enzyme [Candidatus Sulfotelmatobacter sp.]